MFAFLPIAFQTCASSWDKSELCISYLTPYHHVFLRYLLCLVPPASLSYNFWPCQQHYLYIQHVQAILVCPLITRLTGSSPNTSLSSAHFFVFFHCKPTCGRLIILMWWKVSFRNCQCSVSWRAFVVCNRTQVTVSVTRVTAEHNVTSVHQDTPAIHIVSRVPAVPLAVPTMTSVSSASAK